MDQSEQAAQREADVIWSDGVMHEHLGYRLKRAYMVVHRSAATALKGHDLTPRSFTALALIAANPGVTLTELAELLSSERSNLILIVDDFEARELISRKRDTKDRRRYALAVTIKGQSLLDRASKDSRKQDARIASSLEQAEFEHLLQLLSKIEEA
tara:strand:+ start:1027 stop:1494 length:468 start_codon:yes stop_codon:yes gene_type:complete